MERIGVTLADVLNKAAVVVLLGLVGLSAGVGYGMLVRSHEMGETLMLTADSPHSAPDLVTTVDRF